MRSITGLVIFLIFLLLIDFYVYRGIRILSADWEKTSKFILSTSYWLVSLGILALLVYSMIQMSGDRAAMTKPFYAFSFGILIMLLVPKLIFAVFLLVQDISQGGVWIFTHLASNKPSDIPGPTMPRITFLSKMGLGLAAIPFVGIGYGMLKGRFDFRVIKKKLHFKNLPPEFEGFKIVQISDAHLGSFFHDYNKVEKGLAMVNKLEPDLLLFTGDMVNNIASETEGWEPYMQQLHGKYGKYAILGNHDYGDYVEWPSEEAKAKNLDYLKQQIAKMGYRLLLDEHVKIEKDGAHFELIGVQNWGAGGFAKYGNLDKAMKGTDPQKFQLLMSHDPSHWDVQVQEKTKIDLTLSGHTHGMQFGIEIPGLKWSPVQYRYPHWAGLYRNKEQHLYVNRGFGYIGFPGRVGIWPEVTMLELHKA